MDKIKQKVDFNYWISAGILLLFFIVVFYLQHQPQGKINSNLPIFPLMLKDWRGEELTIDEDAINLINPDTYIFRDYIGGADTINVFIGYYETLEKSDLAHSPLVCYPGQGWKISDKKRISVDIDHNSVDFTRIRVSKGSVEHLVLYGYKATHLITESLIKARLHLIKEKLFYGRSQSAFIRFSIKIKNGDLNYAQNSIINFIAENTFLLHGLDQNEAK